MKLYEIMKQTTCEAVINELISRACVDADEKDLYAGVYRRLREMEPCGKGLTAIFDEAEDEAMIFDGGDHRNACHAAWPDWLGADVVCFTKGPCSADTIVAACLLSMTEYGFGEEVCFADFACRTCEPVHASVMA